MSGTTVVVLPPGSERGTGSYVCISDAEWIAATLRRGDRCWFRNRVNIGGPLSKWKAGTVKGSMLHDGVMIAVVEDDPDDRIVHKLHFDSSDRYGDDIAPWSPTPPEVAS